MKINMKSYYELSFLLDTLRGGFLHGFEDVEKAAKRDLGFFLEEETCDYVLNAAMLHASSALFQHGILSEDEDARLRQAFFCAVRDPKEQ